MTTATACKESERMVQLKISRSWPSCWSHCSGLSCGPGNLRLSTPGRWANNNTIPTTNTASHCRDDQYYNINHDTDYLIPDTTCILLEFVNLFKKAAEVSRKVFSIDANLYNTLQFSFSINSNVTPFKRCFLLVDVDKSWYHVHNQISIL